MDGHKRMGGLRRFLGGLPTGQRLAAVTIVVVMIASGWWLGTSRPVSGGGMEPVLDRSFSIAELTSITERLRSQSIPHEIREDRVYVPTARRMEALADLYEVEAFRERTADGFDAMVKQMSPWDLPEKTDKLFTHDLQKKLASMIMQRTGVRKATVIINPTNERRLNGLSVRPTATVDILTRADEAGGAVAGQLLDRRQIADAAVTSVIGSVANLSRDQVMVTIDGASYNAGAEAATAAAAREAVEHQQRLEQVHAAKLRQLLQFIPNVVVSVSVGGDPADETGGVDADPFTDGGFPLTPGARTEATGVSESDSVVANAVPTIPSAGAADESRGALSGRPAPAVSGIAPTAAAPGGLSGPGKSTVRSASVAVPRSYFAKIYIRASSNPSIQPDDALLQPIVNDHAAKIRALVKNSLGLESDAAVTVEAFDDGITIAGFAPLPGGNAPATASAIQNPALLLNAHAKEIALVMMGIVVMLVLSMTFRRSPAPAAAIASPAAVTRPAGAAARERHGLLDGEIEDEPQTAAPPTVHVTHEQEAHQLFRRVRDMVSDNPKDAARVLQDWIYEDR